MPTPRAIICLCGALAVAASGCGSSSKKASTTTSASAPTNATPQTATQGTSQSTGPTGATTGPTGAQPTGKAHGPSAAEAQSKRQQAAEAQRRRERAAQRLHPLKPKQGVKPVTKARLEEQQRLSKKKQYPEVFQQKFIASCQVAKGSPSLCGCVLKKQEFSNVEKGQSLGELLALEIFAFRKRGKTVQEEAHPRPAVKIPALIRRHLEECSHGK